MLNETGKRTPEGDSVESLSNRLNKIMSSSATYMLGILLSIILLGWNTMASRVDKLETSVVALQRDTVSRQELKDEMALLRQQMDRNNTDILSRLDLILKVERKR